MRPTSPTRPTLRVVDAWPARALSRPGEAVELRLELECPAHDSFAGEGGATEAGAIPWKPTAAILRADLLDNGRPVAGAEAEVELAPGLQTHSVAVRLPPEAPRGYEAVLRLEPSGGGSRSSGPHAENPHACDFPPAGLEARTAVLVARHWREAPRYGFLSEFPPGEAGVERIAELARYHLTVVQFYDWMYRHWRFLPPGAPAEEGSPGRAEGLPGHPPGPAATGVSPEGHARVGDEFEDAMGRRLSFTTVRSRIEACREAGMAALGYGAVYGAEPEFVRERPDWVLRDATGEPLSLIDLFYITDLRPGAPWREHILREFECAVRDAGFDGIHMDQYGFPKWSYDSSGTPVDLAACFGGLIDDAARRVAARREGAAVLFNAVNNWPLERVAHSDQAAVYIEVWPPHDSYGDLVGLVRRARDLSGKHAILAAYLEPFRDGGSGAEEAALLATAVIASAGGFHLLLGEGDAVLRDPYYPNHGRMAPAFARRMRRYYDHTAALHHYLYDAALEECSGTLAGGINTELLLAGAATSSIPRAGAVWLAVRQRGAQLVVNLVNLTNAADERWNAPKAQAPVLEGLRLRLSRHYRLNRATWTSPDEGTGTRELSVGRGGEGEGLELPPLRVWATLVLDLE